MNDNMNLNPLLAGIAAASGGSALLCYLKLRELTDRIWGLSPVYNDFAPWMWGTIISLLTCLVALIIMTRPRAVEGCA